MKQNLLKVIIGTIGFALLTSCANRVFYQPDRRVYRTRLLETNPPETIVFESRDGAQLSGFFIKAKGKAKGTIVHFHGNAQNMTSHSAYVGWAPRCGWNVFMFDYRGYGRSGGYPTRRGVYEDCTAALKYIFRRKDIDPRRVVVFGQSLGGANAIAAIAANPQLRVRGLVVDSTFTSYRGIAFHHLKQSIWLWPLAPFLPILISSGYDPDDYAADLRIPTLFIHCQGDRVIPASHSQRLYQLARSPKELLILPGGRHASGVYDFPQQVVPRINAFFTRCVARKDKRDL